jgi:hypothetical protein
MEESYDPQPPQPRPASLERDIRRLSYEMTGPGGMVS